MHDHDPSKANQIPNIEEVTESYLSILSHNQEHTGLDSVIRHFVRGHLQEGQEIIDYDSSQDAEPGFSPEEGSLADRISQAERKLPKEEPPAQDADLETGETNNEAEQDRQVVEGDMAAELQELFHGEIFERIGIKIKPFGNQIVSLQGERLASTELVPIVENTTLFTDFLSTLQPDDLKGENKLGLMVDVIRNLRKIVEFCYKPEDRELDEDSGLGTQYGEDSLRTFLTLDTEYKRLGLDYPESYKESLAAGQPEASGDEYNLYQKAAKYREDYEAMETYLTYWGRDVLSEYIFAEKKQYIQPIEDQKFGPAGWNQDATGKEDIVKKWSEALDFVEGMRGVGRTQEFAAEVYESLKKSFAAAKQWIENQKNSADSNYPEDYLEEQSKALSEVQARFILMDDI